MQPDPYLPADATLTACTWCGAALEQNAKPSHINGVFCSQHCEIQANFWLFQEMRLIEITHRLLSPDDFFAGIEDEYDMPDNPSGY